MKRKTVLTAIVLFVVLIFSTSFSQMNVMATGQPAGGSQGAEQTTGNVYAAIFCGRTSVGCSDVAEGLHNALVKNKLPGYRTESANIHIYGNSGSNKIGGTDEIKNDLEEAYGKCTEKDLCIFYYSGHCSATKNEYGLWFGSLINGFLYSYDSLLKDLSNYRFGNYIIIIDGCVAGLIHDSINESLSEDFRSRLYVMTSTGSNKNDDLCSETFFTFTKGLCSSSGVDGDSINYADGDSNKDGVIDVVEAYYGACSSDSEIYDYDFTIPIYRLKDFFKYASNTIHMPTFYMYDDHNHEEPLLGESPVNYKNQQTLPPLFQFQYLDIDEDDITVYAGSEYSKKLTAKKHYENIVDQHVIRWTSDDESVATVDQDGNVTGVSPGSTTITAHLDTNKGVECLGAEAKCEVTVKKVSTEILQDSMKIYIGEKGKIDYKIEGPSKECKWTSSNPSVVTVENGEVKGIKQGKVIVTLEANKESDIIQIEVLGPCIESDNLTLQKGESIKIPYKVHGPVGDIEFSSSDKSIVSVDKNGVATGHKVGTAQITLKAYKSKTIIEVRVVDSNDQDESTSAVQGVHDEFGGGEEDSSAGEPNAEIPPEQDLTMEGIGLAYGHYDGIKPQGDGAIPAEVDLYEDGTFRMHCLFDLFSMNSSDHTYTGTYTVDRINGDGNPVLVFRTDDREFEMIYDGSMLSHENFFFFIE